MSEIKPEWRKAWKVDDPEWLKERQRSWKNVKSSPVFDGFYDKENMAKLRNFYLFGRAYNPEPPEKDWLWLTYHPEKSPLAGVRAYRLYEIWFSPNDNLQHWDKVIAKSTEYELSSCRYFIRDMFRRHYPVNGNVFGHKEKTIYHLFGPTRFDVKTYASKPVDHLTGAAARIFMDLGNVIELFFENEYNPQSIASATLPEFCDALIPYSQQVPDDEFCAYRPEEVAEFIGKPLEILQNSDDYHPEQVKAAQYMIDRLNDEDLEPDHLSPIKTAISEAGFARK
jgi:hypothetical protein